MHTGLGAVLDDDCRAVGHVLVALATAVVLALFLAVAMPAALLAAPKSMVASLGSIARRALPIVPTEDAPPAVPGNVIQVARRYLNVPYVFGGTDPAVGLDCSGLVQLVYRQVGIQLPRTAQQQYAATLRISDAELQPGDLVFFARTYADAHDWITHVGIYIGGGQQINAPTTGQVVSIQPAFSGFWGAHYAGAGRVRGS